MLWRQVFVDGTDDFFERVSPGNFQNLRVLFANGVITAAKTTCYNDFAIFSDGFTNTTERLFNSRIYKTTCIYHH